MKKLTAIFLILVSLMTVLLVGCDGVESWSGTVVVETSTSKSWNVSWGSLNGTKSHKLTLDGEETLEYSISGDTDNISVTVTQEDISKELSLEDTEMSLEDFSDGKIKIVIEVTDADESELHFELN